jgi:hypothetical protein
MNNVSNLDIKINQIAVLFERMALFPKLVASEAPCSEFCVKCMNLTCFCKNIILYSILS